MKGRRDGVSRVEGLRQRKKKGEQRRWRKERCVNKFEEKNKMSGNGGMIRRKFDGREEKLM